jgi:hypothetical protein
MKLFPKPKKIVILGFKFLQTSIIIFALTLLSFLSLALNIKQMNDYQTLKTGYSKQAEYIYQLQSKEKVDNKQAK